MREGIRAVAADLPSNIRAAFIARMQRLPEPRRSCCLKLAVGDVRAVIADLDAAFPAVQ